MPRPFLQFSRMRSQLINVYRLPIPSDVILSAWFRQHLFTLGFDKLKLQLYEKFSEQLAHGGLVKAVVFDLSLFLKREWSAHSELLEHVGPEFAQHTRISDFRWFYISLGYMLLSQPESNLDEIADKVVQVYMKLRGAITEHKISDLEKRILRLGSKYYKSVKINYKLLYDHRMYPRSIRVGDFTITLPPLPQIRTKQLLAKALMHKELATAILNPAHELHRTLADRNIEVDRLAVNVIRSDLLFLDGLGDFFLATELSEFLYQFRLLEPYCADHNFGRKSYNLLRTILATNTLLLRLAVAYNMHLALDDPVVGETLRESYIPLTSGTDSESCGVRYEEEFVADFFEQYVGALYLEQPEVAKVWINLLFELLLSLITDTYRFETKKRVHYDYRAWSTDVIGRSL